MTTCNDEFEREIASGRRFRFGENWTQFLSLLDESRIRSAERSLSELLGPDSLRGKSFLDIGSGSGLFSLAARRLHAKVRSLDFDPLSVACTRSLRDRYFPDDEDWLVARGSVLDRGLMQSLPRFDVVYSWGVLHHTGDLSRALDHTLERVANDGCVYLALYRKTWLCPLWKLEKRAYCKSSTRTQALVRSVYKGSLGLAYRVTHRNAALSRGMDAERDLHDWLGGYPYESITPTRLKSYVTRQGFSLERESIKSEGVHLVPGCDQFVFRRTPLSWA